MSFDVAADAYDRFMDAWPRLLAPQLADLADVGAASASWTSAADRNPSLRSLSPGSAATASWWSIPPEPFFAAAIKRHPGGGRAARPGRGSPVAGTRGKHLTELLEAPHLTQIDETALGVSREYGGFEDWWVPFTRGVGPDSAFLAGFEPNQQRELRERCRSMLPAGSLTLAAQAWLARGEVHADLRDDARKHEWTNPGHSPGGSRSGRRPCLPLRIVD